MGCVAWWRSVRQKRSVDLASRLALSSCAQCLWRSPAQPRWARHRGPVSSASGAGLGSHHAHIGAAIGTERAASRAHTVGPRVSPCRSPNTTSARAARSPADVSTGSGVPHPDGQLSLWRLLPRARLGSRADRQRRLAGRRSGPCGCPHQRRWRGSSRRGLSARHGRGRTAQSPRAVRAGVARI